MSPAAPKLDPDALAALEEQRDFLLRSITDLDRELAAGDIEPDDHATLRDDYTARAAEVIRAIDAQKAGLEAAKRPRSLGRTLATVGAIAAFALIAGFTVASAMGARKAGDSVSGGITVEQTASQRANQCIPKMQTDPSAALDCFDDVRKDDPKNPVAMTWTAWLLSNAAESTDDAGERVLLQGNAAVLLDSAVEVDARYSPARAFRAIVAYRNGRYADAKRYLEDFEASNPSAEAKQIIEQQGLADRIDAALAAEGSTTTTAPGATTTTAPGAGG